MVNPDLLERFPAATFAAAGALDAVEPLLPGPAVCHTPSVEDLPADVDLAFTASLVASGPTGVTGELVLVLDREQAASFRAASGGQDVAQQVVDAFAAALDATSGPVQEVSPDAASARWDPVAGASQATPVLSALTGAADPGDAPVVRGTLVLLVQAASAGQVPERRGSARSVDADIARIGLLRDVALEVSTELGRSRITVQDLLSLKAGSVVELDREIGAPADLLVNGTLIARGEVVVVEDCYGIRITEIVMPASETGAA
jgi:flagellar motor switch protein FliN/FliY